MGGKNAIIVDSDADLDEAVTDVFVRRSRYAGQKCSAGSRVLVHEAVAETFLSRLRGAVESLRVGQAEDFSIDVPPVIEQDAQRTDHGCNRGRRERGPYRSTTSQPSGRRLVLPPDDHRRPPAGFRGRRDEIFGPVLTLKAVANVDAALDVVNASRYALTGGIFTRNPRVIDKVIERSPVGNLYINRSITGAIVARQPFGGNRRSGIGAKVGGPDYVLQFVEPQVITENTMRHGLVVE